ncbi:hypothetical protein FKP32DRAFT_1678858 [Trametes sanguinea]|nr:hypothetical protein FKP32DRAFT_1678858 [Trametes sanguinea]
MSELPQTVLGRKRPLTDHRAHEFIGDGKSRRVGQQTNALHLELVKNAEIAPAPHTQSFGPRPPRPLPAVPTKTTQKTTQKTQLGREPSFHVDPQPARPHRGQIIRREASFKVQPQLPTVHQPAHNPPETLDDRPQRLEENALSRVNFSTVDLGNHHVLSSAEERWINCVGRPTHREKTLSFKKKSAKKGCTGTRFVARNCAEKRFVRRTYGRKLSKKRYFGRRAG